MLTNLIAIGIFAAAPEASTGTVIATAERTVVLGVVQSSSATAASIPLGALPWRQQFDPGDHAPYAFDFTALLATDEKIAAIEAIKVSSAAALIGVAVDSAAGYSPIIDADGKKLQVWFVVDQAFWESLSFSAAGVQLPITVRILTDASPPKRFERTGILTVRQL